MPSISGDASESGASPPDFPHPQDEERYKELFEKLDANKDGHIQVDELADALKQRGNVAKHHIEGHAQQIISDADEDSNQELSFAEFVGYMHQHEKKLMLAFKDLDHNKDGEIDPSEVQAAFAKLDVHIDEKEAIVLTKRLDRDGDLKIDWEEWRDFFMLCPQADKLESLMAMWRHGFMIDIGEQLTVPPEFTQKEKETGMWWRYLVAGGIAGAVSRTATAPLDRLKVMMQVHGAARGITVLGGLKQMLKEGGVRSLWRGNGTNVIKIAPEAGVKNMTYELMKKVVTGGDPTSITPGQRFIAGACAGTLAQTAIYPLEVIKTRLAVAKTGDYKGLIDCGIKIFKRGGLRSLYRGYLPNIVGIIPYAGIDLTVYETLKTMYMKTHQKEEVPGVMVLLGCGTLSSTCGQVASYPLALIRTKLQAAETTKEAGGGMIPLVKSIMKKEGPLGFYRGILPNFMKVIPAVSISYVVYEQSKQYLATYT